MKDQKFQLTTTLNNRKIFDNGAVFFEPEELIEVAYNRGLNRDNIFTENTSEVQHYNKMCDLWDFEKISTSQPEIKHDEKSNSWNIPQEYKNLNIKDYLLKKCQNNEEIERVQMELKVFESCNMINVLKTMVYIIDKMQEKGVIWGVGRGSSVSSYSLYLIGIHSVDSIKYNLDFSEFLKA